MSRYGWAMSLLGFALVTYITTLFYLDSLDDHVNWRLCLEKGRQVQAEHNGVSCKK